jgi:protein O-mannosyl-transferase
MTVRLSHPLQIAVVTAISVFCLAVFYPALRNEFVWDDVIFLVRSSAYTGLDGLFRSLIEPFALFGSYYRPMVALTFALIPASSPSSAEAHHAINIALHAANVLLVFFCAKRAIADLSLTPGSAWLSTAIPIVAALILAVHPLVLEPVLWVSGRFDLAVTLFCLLFVWLDFDSRESAARTFLLALVYFCAAASKESAVSFPIAMLVLHTLFWTYKPEAGSWRAYMMSKRRAYVAIALGGVMYLGLRFYALGTPGIGSSLLQPAISVLDRLALAGTSLFEYGRLVFTPWTSTAPWHPFDIATLSSTERLAIAVATVSLAIALVIAAVKFRWRWAYVALIFVAMLLPVLHVVSFSLSENLIADRYALTPLALALVAAAPLCAERLARVSRSFMIALAIVTGLILISWIAIARITTVVWRDDISLWAYAYTRSPQSQMVASNYAASLMKLGKLDEAERVATKIYETGKATMGPVTNLAMIKAHRGDIDGAYAVLQSIEISKSREARDDNLGTYYCTFAQLDTLRGDSAAALSNSNIALQYAPDSIVCQMVKARALFGVGSKAEAMDLVNALRPKVELKVQNEIDQLIVFWQKAK